MIQLLRLRAFIPIFCILIVSTLLGALYLNEHKKGHCMALDPQKTVFLIDGSGFLYRAYYGLRPLHTKQGVPVQAVYSFCRMIKKLTDTFKPQYLALVWDSKGPTVRHTLYPAYKATRSAPPSDLFEQRTLIQKFADLIGIKQFEQPGIEADDILFSLAQDFGNNGSNVVLITSDKDMEQVLSEQITIYDPFKDLFITQETFAQKRGFPVEKLPFYFALVGDTSDNIPGVQGVGEKTATSLVQQFASLKDLYEHLDKVPKEKLRITLQENKDNAFLSEQLFLLRSIPLIGTAKEGLSFDIKNWPQAQPLFEELEFKSLLKDLGVQAPQK